MKQEKIKAISLYSGGLDSILAIKIIREAANCELKIIPIKFFTPFFNYKDDKEFQNEKTYLKQELDVELRLIDITQQFIPILDNPLHGFGKNLNPCIDCKILMLKTAREIMRKEKAAFIFSGEVVGQRPMSQQINQMRQIEREAGLEGFLLRPLSALLLDETIPEKKGIIERSKLLNINGRSRKMQLELADKYSLKYFTTPSGGCLLTDMEYARKLKIIKSRMITGQHLLNCLRWGRLFMVGRKLLVVGRNEFENKKLLESVETNDILIQPKNIPGPLCILLDGKKLNASDIMLAAGICAHYIKDNSGDYDKDNSGDYDMEYGNLRGQLRAEKQVGRHLTNIIKVKGLDDNQIALYKV